MSLAEAFAPGQSLPSGGALDEALTEFARDPSPGNGYKLLRSQGAGRWSAGRYWVKAASGGLWQRLRGVVMRLLGLAPKPASPAEGAATAEAIGGRFASAMQLMARRGGQALSAGDVKILAEAASAMARDYERLTGDGAPAAAISSRASDPEALSYWMSRIAESAEGFRQASAPAATVVPAGREAVMGLFARIKTDPKGAALVASELQFLADDAGFLTLGRTTMGGRELWVQGSRRVLSDGRELVLAALRDPRSGRFAYGWAEARKSGAPPKPIPPRALRALIAH
jgi:hypothetical protein